MKNLKQRIKEGILALGIVACMSSLSAEELIPLLRYNVEGKMNLEVKHQEFLDKKELQKMKLREKGYINLVNFYSEELEKYKMKLEPHPLITIEASRQ